MYIVSLISQNDLFLCFMFQKFKNIFLYVYIYLYIQRQTELDDIKYF